MPKITKAIVDRTPHPELGQRFIRDDALPGFALRVTPGSKSFVMEKWIDGRTRRITLGRYGAITTEQARTLAMQKAGDIARGENPAELRKLRRQGLTFQELETLYLERHAAHKKSRSNDVTNLDRHLAYLRPRRLTAISRADIATLHADLGQHHSCNANRTVALLRCMFNLAADWGLYEGENPAGRIKMFKEVSRDRFVTPDELPRLFAAIQAEANPYVRGAVFLCLLTGARRNEVLQMQWTDLDLTQAVWRIPETKAGRPHLIPLPGAVLAELAKLPKLAGTPYVFCGRWGRGHLVNIAKPWRAIRTRAKLTDVRLHDLRRTLASWMVAAGNSLPIIGKTLNHSQPSTTAIYARLDVGPVRAALEANAEKMLAVVAAAQPRKKVKHAS